MFNVARNKLSEFIWGEREKYNGKDNNRFAFSLGQAVQYYEYLLLIANRYEKVSREFVSNIKRFQAQCEGKSGKLSPTQMTLLQEQRDLSMAIHLEIESFYIFAKVLMDKLAHFIQDYFGNVRGCSLASHNKLTNNYERFASEKGIVYPARFADILAQLQEHISEYRDKQITHLKNPRSIRGTSFGEGGETRIVTSYLYPNDREVSRRAVESKPIPNLMQAIDRYLQQVIEIVRLNREKSRFALKA